MSFKFEAGQRLMVTMLEKRGATDGNEVEITILHVEEKSCPHKYGGEVGRMGQYFTWSNNWRGSGCSSQGSSGCQWFFDDPQVDRIEVIKVLRPLPPSRPICLKGNPGYDLMM